MVLPDEYFDSFPSEERDEANKLFTVTNEMMPPGQDYNQSDRIIGSWLLSSVIRQSQRPQYSQSGFNLNGLVIQIADVAQSEYFSKMPTNVESVIDYVIALLEIENSGISLFNLDGEGKDFSSIEMRRIAVRALQSMKNEMFSSVYAHSDFLRMWKSCHAKTCPIFESRPDISKLDMKFAWLLVCALQLSHRKENEDARGRRERTVSIMACISFIAGITNVNPGNGLKLPQSSLKRTRSSKGTQKHNQHKRSRRLAMNKALSSMYQEDVAKTEIAPRWKALDPLPINEPLMNTLIQEIIETIPHFKIQLHEVEKEFFKIGTFVSQKIKKGDFDPIALGTEEGRKNFSAYIEELIVEEIGAHWINEVKIYDTKIRPYLTKVGKLPPDNQDPIPAIETESDQLVEFTNWIETLLVISAQSSKPSVHLLKLLVTPGDRMSSNKVSDSNCLENMIVPLLTDTLHRYVEMTGDPEIVEIDEAGVAKCQKNYPFGEQKGKLCTATICRAVVALYYYALESILHHERMRLRTVSNERLVMNKNFHKGVVCISLICVERLISTRKYNTNSSWRFSFAFDVSESTPYNYLKVSDSFVRSLCTHNETLQGSFSLRLPKLIVKQMQDIEQTILRSRIWKNDPTGTNELFNTLSELQKHNMWPSKILEHNKKRNEDDGYGDGISKESNHLQKERAFISSCMDKILFSAGVTISLLLSELGIVSVASRAFSIFQCLLREKTEIFHDRHMHKLILCIIYSVTPDKSFSDVIKVYMRIFPGSPEHSILSNISLERNESGNIIMFYNKVFLPLASKFLDDSTKGIDSVRTSFGSVSVNIRNDELRRGKTTVRNIQFLGSATKKSDIYN